MCVFQASEKESDLVLSHLAAYSARLTGGRDRRLGRKGAGLRVLRSLREAYFPNCSRLYHFGRGKDRCKRGGGHLPRPPLLNPIPISRVDLVVHSLKDLPTVLPPGFTIGAICK